MSIVNSMNIDEKIGQLFMIGINGTQVDDAAREMLEKYHAGGVILFARNIIDGAQVSELTASLRKFSKYSPAVAIDQEGGLVLRLTECATVLGGNMAIAACGEEKYDDYCAQWGRITARELRNLGFTLNLAPVLDVNNIKNPGIGARSFSDNSFLCARLGAALITAMQNNGISACAKHFPGKGDAAADAHIDLPVIDSTLDEIRVRALLPFKRAIEAGVDAVMTAHVLYRGISGENMPATLSYNLLTGLLKKELGFQGPLITDDMEMGAIKKYYPQPEACFKSFMAGSDIILICHTKELQLQTINYFKDRYVHGELCEQRLNDALERIFRMKSRYENFRVESDAGAPDYKKNAGFAQNLADSSLTLVSDPNQILAKIHSGDLKFKKMNKIFIIEAEFEAITQVEDTNSDSALPLLIKKEFAFSKVEIIHEKFGVKIEPIKSVALYKKLEELGLKEAFVILLTYNAHIFQGQRELASLISQNAAYTIAAAVRNPYDLMCVSEKACKLATYGFRRSNMLSLYKTIFQGMKPSGILPVELKCNNS